MFYKFCRFILKFIILLFWQIRAEGEESIINEGSMILASNHVSYLDPVVLGVIVKRPIHFIAKKEVFDVPILGFIVKALGAIPVNRKKANPVSIKKSIILLKKNHVLGIFPEGSRSLDGKQLEFNPGIIKIALKTGAPIVTVGIKGTFEIYPPKAKIPNFFKRKTIYIQFGKPIYLDNSKAKDIQYQKESLSYIQNRIKLLTKTTTN